MRGLIRALRIPDTILPYLFLAPAGLLLAAFWIYPLFEAAALSLQTKAGGFAGLQNYRRLLSGGAFWRSFGVSLWFLAGTTPLTMALGFLAASLLFRQLRGMGLFRTIYFLPYVTSTVAAAMVWRWIFSPRPSGVANELLRWMAVPPQRWYYESAGVFDLIASGCGVHLPEWAAGPSLALVCVMLFSVWQTIGFDIVVLLAALSMVPREIYEAAELDGATGWRRMWWVTLPLISPTFFFLGIVSVIRSFQTFNQIYVMTREESVGSTQNLTMLIFNTFYGTYNYNAACAAAILLFLILLALTLLQMKTIGARVHY